MRLFYSLSLNPFTLCMALFMWICFPLQAQEKYTISGYVEDADSGEKLIAATVFDLHSKQGTITNTYGFFSLTLPKDSVELVFSYVGYEAQSLRFLLKENTQLNIKLRQGKFLDEVEVVAEKVDRIERNTQMSQTSVPVEQIKKLPALLGEVDIFKTLQLLPGVQSGGEGQSGLYVRGGSPDQNLILLDGVPVYNVSHILGIFSVFNADAIRNVTLTKGGFPARYGGRLSSVLEINMKEGNLNEWHGEGAIGLISSKVTLEGPLAKGKTSMLVSARRTYVDLIARPIIKAAARAEGIQVKPQLYFYDLNAKLQHRLNDKHRLYASFYSGSDRFFFKYEESYLGTDTKSSGGINWGNIISALRWNWQLNPKLFANTTLTFSDYSIDISQEYSETLAGHPELANTFSAKYVSGIRDFAAKVDFDYLPLPRHFVRFGLSAIRHTYRPGALTLEAAFEEERFDTLLGSQNIHSLEYDAYLEDDFRWKRFSANIGLHASLFQVQGTFYPSIQPRIGLRYMLSNKLALKASYSQMQQFINLLTSESLNLPTDLWVPSTERVKPQKSWQAALGIAQTLQNDWEVSLEVYYKEMQNVLSFKEGASFLLGLEGDWQDKITQGSGQAYGAELLLQKKFGRFSGWLAYTLAWNWRQFDEINSGKRFPFRYDRRHDISLVGTYELNDRITLSGAWVYGTGNAVTLPIYQYTYLSPYQVIETLGNKNSFRMSDYHRLDFSISFFKQKKRYERRWVLGAYNLYNHNNPYFIITSNSPFERAKLFKEISILPIIPYFSWQFKF